MLREIKQSKAEGRIMNTVSQNEALANLPISELEAAIEHFLQPVTDRLPDTRLGRVVRLGVQGISSSQSPIVTQMARGVTRTSTTIWAMTKRFYRLLAHRRIRHRDLLKGLYAHAQQRVAQEAPEYVIVALDPVNAREALLSTRRRCLHCDKTSGWIAGKRNPSWISLPVCRFPSSCWSISPMLGIRAPSQDRVGLVPLPLADVVTAAVGCGRPSS
jgi:hypothetical protein